MLFFVYAQKILPLVENKHIYKRKLVVTLLKCSQHKHMLKVIDLNTLLNQSLNYNCRANFHLLSITINTVRQQGLTKESLIPLLAAFNVVHCSCSSDKSSHLFEQNITCAITALSPNAEL